MPYILNTQKEIKEMLNCINLNSIEDLYSHLPKEIILEKSLNLPMGLSELEVKKIIEKLAQKNQPIKNFNSFLGAGCYDHYIPSACNYILSRSEFSTPYTPYQAECSQGALQAIYEYQSYICLLTGMDVSNASLFDGASSLAESVLMSLRITQRKKVLIASSIHPEYRQTLKTYLSGLDVGIEEIGFEREGSLDIKNLKKYLNDEVSCLAIQSPNFFGIIEKINLISPIVKEKKAQLILVTYPLSLAILKEPAYLGVDIVCGDGQPLGGSLNFGGPTFGFLATKNEFLRQIPGRIVGKTIDKDGKICYCLTLQTREQHIRREKATSNICTNQSLNAIGAAIYLSLLGKEEFTKVASYSLNLAHFLYNELKKLKNVELPFSTQFFNEFVWKINDAKKVIDKLYKKKIIAGLYLGNFYPQLENCILSCCTEKKTKEEIFEFIKALKEI